ncbi:helix-turn-helix transcriptional regulator [Pendulispora albinea]|uniref:Helix-turn-helix transcriptional regulator n=1 Tax=Pendulispora albinea TaxID=2741071 RepID=A0ABZ2M056_9BACT
MRVASMPYAVTLGDTELPLWPPLLATRGRGSKSVTHVHHAMHIVLSLQGDLAVRAGKNPRAPWQRAAGVLTAPDVPHAIDAEGIECFLVFLDPESDVGTALGAVLTGPVRLISAKERDELLRDQTDPFAVMAKDGVAWTERAAALLGGAARPVPRRIHPRVRKLLRLFRTMPAGADTSLEALAEAVDLSPGRLMHAFSESIGLPLRPYLAWLRLQRAAAAVASGLPLAHAAHTAGFSDSAHMSRTFRRMFGMTPSALQP